MLEPEQYQELLEHLKIVVKIELEKENRRWDIDDLAKFFKVSKSTISRYRLQPDFPEPITYPYESNGVTRYTLRWVPREIKNWKLRRRVA